MLILKAKPTQKYIMNEEYNGINEFAFRKHVSKGNVTS